MTTQSDNPDPEANTGQLFLAYLDRLDMPVEFQRGIEALWQVFEASLELYSRISNDMMILPAKFREALAVAEITLLDTPTEEAEEYFEVQLSQGKE